MLLVEKATILTGTGAKLVETDLLIDGNKIKAIGSSLPHDKLSQVISGKGKVVTPGLIDVHTHLGVHEEGLGVEGRDFNETSNPVTPYVRALDGINPFDSGFEDARRSGVTTVQILPGSANVIGGEMVTVKTTGTVVDEMILREPSGMKSALGENPKRIYGGKGKAPITRMGIAGLFRKEMFKAQEYLKNKQAGTLKEFDLGLENLAKVLTKEIPLRTHAHRADDIATILRLKKEFDFDLTIEHVTEGHLIPEYIARHDVPVSVGPTMSTRSKPELANKSWQTAKVLNEHNVSISITTDHPVIGIDQLVTSTIFAIKNGLPEETALSSITLNASKHLGVEDRVGSLEVGKDADFVIWSGSPFDLSSNVEQTYINGLCVYKA